MISNFSILILTHFISDWFLQPAKWGIGKHSNIKYLFYHSIQYTIPFLIVFYFLQINLYWTLYIFGTHMIIDTYLITKFWNRYIKREKETPIWLQTIQDQILHILILIPVLR